MKKFLLATAISLGLLNPTFAEPANWIIVFHMWIDTVGSTQLAYATQKHGAFFFETKGDCEIFEVVPVI